MSVLADAEARRRIRDDLDATLVVEAAAGTGKTTELVARIVAVLKSGRATLSEMVAVTFTEKAAGEMKLRLRGAVERARREASAEESERLDRALAELEIARIGTIHSFCADLLHERPVEARVDPVFEVAAQEEADRLLDQAFDAWLERALADPPEGVRRALRRRPKFRDDAGPSERLRQALRKLADHRDFDAPFSRPPLSRSEALDGVVERLVALATYAPLAEQQENNWLTKHLWEVKRFVDELAHRESVRGRDHDGLEAELRGVATKSSWRWNGRWQRFGDRNRDEVIAERDEAKAELDRVLEACDADLAACLQAELWPILADYEALKSQAGKLDFLDLLLKARDLVRDEAAVRRDLQARIRHVFVDEFQDTDPLQAEILMLLCADDPDETDWLRVRPRPGKLFIVGDPKQSIYRFRRADVALYEAVKRRLLACGAELAYLTTSFRSVPAIQAAVNAAFSEEMAPKADSEQAAYVALEPFRTDHAAQPAIVALSVPRPYSARSGKLAHWVVEQSVPDAVGAFVDFLVNESGWTVTEREHPDRRVPVAARHVCLLLKRFQKIGEDVTRDYVRALEARRIPHVLVGGRSFHAREEILAIRNALTAIEWPDDELAVYATLRGPFFALHDEALLVYRHHHRTLHPLRRHEQLDDEVARALDVLGRLHAGRNRRPVADTIARLLEATRAHAGIAIWPHGEQALANLLRMHDLARRFETRGATSFRAFVERLEDDAARGEAADAPVVEEGTEGVRIMTVHRAKGLEFPVVIVCEPTARPTPTQPSRYVDAERRLWAEPLAGCMPRELLAHRDEALRRDAEEAVRLSYVAATRARDLLVVPAVGDAPVEGWLDVMHPALYPALEQSRAAARAPGCPPFGDDSVLERPARCDYEPSVSVAPGLHVPQRGTHRVVWWDPRRLGLDKHHDVGLRQERLLAADEAGAVSQAGIEAHAAWQEARASVLARGAAPSMRVESVTAASHGMQATGAQVPVERTEAERRGRPHGTRFGTLVHAVLAVVALEADGEAVARLSAQQGRLIGAPSEEIAAAEAAVVAALRHPLLCRAAAAAVCRREAPLLRRLDDGTLLEGVVDLAFREEGDEGGRWTVVDFKTDAELGERLESYALQVSAYAEAIAAATGEPVEGLLLLV